MTQVHVVHRTTYCYTRPVRFTPHRLMLRPRDSHDLRFVDASLALTPPPASTRWAHDVFGNSVCYLDWGEAESEVLDIVSTLDIDHYPSGRRAPEEILEPLAETYPFSYAHEEFPDLARLIERQHADPERAVDGWVRGFLKGMPTRTMELLAAITQGIREDFAYEARDEEGTNPPTVTLATRRGACRDFALLMMEAVRALGLAARFVSGYVYDDDATAGEMVGGGATHAWCAVYLPGAGWVEFDPTNGLLAGRDLIRVSVARTPEHAVPVAGGYFGKPEDFAGLEVDVQVTVDAPPPPADAAPADQAGSSSSASPTEISPPSTTSA